eukprot:CAMPEP_0178958266 /NCGR_PEP_ID=MMETSP0789-20121207/11505_1 /TAXON_ID=3005 /ORGANISM="Rhizosolenia setigera, Strain CCMP 1694" /LENGTH=61 /DNA_ID=CAMNT_0020640869 /DNA_START=23 /DNA_END=205 /DNA_ORIENTATION=+
MALYGRYLLQKPMLQKILRKMRRILFCGLYREKKYKEGEPILQKCLELQKKSLGENHHDTL